MQIIHLEEFRDRIEISSIHISSLGKLAAVCQKVATVCFPPRRPNILTHGAIVLPRC